MKPTRIFLDGHAGTTGLRIRELLAGDPDVELVSPDEARRKDPAARRECMTRADAVVLCLPDEAAREAVELAADLDVPIVDASTAHRTTAGWVYGLPELDAGQRAAIAAARRIANPGCYPTGVILLLRPLVTAGLLPADLPITVHALSGYTGGGRPMIERWEEPDTGLAVLPFEAPYAFERRHKHVAEMVRYAGLVHAPQFVPAVGAFRCGMRIEIPLHATLLGGEASARSLHEVLRTQYEHEAFVEVVPWAEPLTSDEWTFDPRAANDTNSIRLWVVPEPDGHVLLVCVLDNLGKGAAGAAVQNLNLVLGRDEGRGLRQLGERTS